MLWEEKFRIWVVQMKNLGGLLGIRRMDSFECTDKGVVRSVERIDEGILLWFGHVKRTENDRNAKRVYVGERAGSRSVGRPWKRWIDTVNDCLRKRFGKVT